MKITHIQIEGTRGKATVFRSGQSIVINLELKNRPDDSWVVGCRDLADQKGTARKLQMALDGYYGTNGDVAEYLRIIETFAD